MSNNEIVSEPEYLRSVGTFDSLTTEVNPKDEQDESPVKKVLGRIQEGASAIFSCGKASDVDDNKQEKVKSSTESIWEE